jgi:surface polysaccharide O-acyltransferase-like enzyme
MQHPASPPTISAATAPQTVRDAQLSLLKVMGSIGVVMVHTSMYALHGTDNDQAPWFSAYLGSALGRNMSALFAMVAGAVLLARHIDREPVAFVRERLVRLLPAAVVWSAFYFGWRALHGDPLGWSTVLSDIARGTPYFHMWFLYAMLGLYVLMPAVRLLISDVDARRSQYYTAGVLALGTCVFSVSSVLRDDARVPFVTYTPMLLVYLVTGYLFYRDRPRQSIPKLVLICAVCVGGTLAVMRWLEPAADTRLERAIVQALRAPLAVGWVLTVYLLVLQIPIGDRLARVARTIAPITLGIYVLHPFWIDVLTRYVLPHVHRPMEWEVVAIATYALSAATSAAIACVPALRRLVT